MVGVPGLALPDSALATARLPSVPDMVDASIANSRLARRVARPASPKAASKPGPGAAHSSLTCPWQFKRELQGMADLLRNPNLMGW